MKNRRVFCLLPAVVPAVLLSWGGASAGDSGQPVFSPHVVDGNARGTASLHACDVDGDGNVDILGAVLEDDAVVYWRNGGGNPVVWTKVVIDGEFQRAISVYAADVDGDGDNDVLGAAAGDKEIAIWRNGGGDPVAWTKQTVATEFLFAHEVYAHDLDSDGDTDILAASTNLHRIAWWRNDGGEPIQWIEQIVDSAFVQAKSVRVADFDGDGRLDIVGAALGGNQVAWWRSDGDSPIRWTKFTVAGDFEGAHRVQAVDLDDDGDTDILAAAYGKLHQPFEGNSDRGHMIAWWRNDGGNPPSWTEQIIAKDFQRACIAQAADFDGDGDMDVAGTAQEGNEVALWLNEGGNPVTWTKSTVGELTRVWPLCAVDLDGDGDVDIIAASGWKGTNEVKWWENRRK